MAVHSRLHVLNSILNIGVVPIFYHDDLETAEQIIDACQAGGMRVTEFTNRGDFAIDVFATLRKYYQKASPQTIIGAGTIIDAPTAALYIAQGADFIVSPLWNVEVARLCNRRKIPYLPGCTTPSEISEAEAWGTEIIKLFPGNQFAPSFIKALKGPMPRTNLMVTGGVDATKEDLQRWFAAGASCVGIGSKLIRKDEVQNGDFDAIRARCEQVVTWIQQVR